MAVPNTFWNLKQKFNQWIKVALRSGIEVDSRNFLANKK